MNNSDSAASVSIVIPTYNHCDFVLKAIDSVNRQDFPNVEVIVVDDGSQDQTGVVLSSAVQNFKLLTQKNQGQAASLNSGWTLATGEILGYLSADDIVLPSVVSSAVKIFKEFPDVCVVYSDFELIDPNGVVVRYVRAADFSLERMVTEFECPPGPGALFRRSAFDAAGGWDVSLRRIPDFEFWLRMALQGKFVRIPRALAQWRVHEGSQTFSAIPSERADEPFRVMEKFFARSDLPEEIKSLSVRSKGMAYLISAQLHARSKRWGLAWSRFSVACRLRPTLLLKVSTWRIIANALLQQRLHRMLWAVRRLAQRWL